MIVVPTGNGARRMVQDPFDQLIENAHLAELR